MQIAVAAILALLIGLSLGAVGGGGSILAVPVLIGVAGLTVEQATTSSLVVVGTASVVGMVSHHMAGRVRWGAGLGFGLAGMGGALIGTRINDMLDGDMLLVLFATLMLVVAGLMIIKLRRPGSPGGDDVPARPLPAHPVPVDRPDGRPRWQDGATVRRYVSIPADAVGNIAGAVDAETPPAEEDRTVDPRWTPERVGLVLLTGTAVGLLTGTFGVGGGFVIVPALMLVLGFSLPVATGTSLLVITVNSAVALTMRGGVDAIDWSVVAPFTAAAIVGVLIGRKVADQVPARTLTIALTSLIVVIALWTGYTGLSGLI